MRSGDTHAARAREGADAGDSLHRDTMIRDEGRVSRVVEPPGRAPGRRSASVRRRVVVFRAGLGRVDDDVGLWMRNVRHGVRQSLLDCGIDGVVVVDTVIVVGELLANAALHAHAPLSVCLSIDAGILRIEVGDASARAPRPRGRAERGLGIVSTVSSRWGVRYDHPGKTVWAEIALPAS